MRTWARHVAAGVLSVVVLVGLAKSQEAPRPAVVVPCTVTRVLDGDTIEVEVRMTVRVRLLDCWAPELSERGGSAARQHLQTLVAREQPIRLEVPLEQRTLGNLFTFERLLGRLWVGNVEAGAEQVRTGHATVERRK